MPRSAQPNKWLPFGERGFPVFLPVPVIKIRYIWMIFLTQSLTFFFGGGWNTNRKNRRRDEEAPHSSTVGTGLSRAHLKFLVLSLIPPTSTTTHHPTTSTRRTCTTIRPSLISPHWSPVAAVSFHKLTTDPSFGNLSCRPCCPNGLILELSLAPSIFRHH